MEEWTRDQSLDDKLTLLPAGSPCLTMCLRHSAQINSAHTSESELQFCRSF